MLYRKIDSTLRGHVALEIAATLDIAGPDAFALVCPAYPATRRAMRDGVIFVNGQPLAETEIWKHALWRRRGRRTWKALLAAIGRTGAGAPSGLEAVRGGGLGASASTPRATPAPGRSCATRRRRPTSKQPSSSPALPMGGVRVWVGSGGLTIPLAKALSPGRAAEPGAVTRRAGPTLVAVGSASSVSRGQLAVLAEDPRVLTLRVPPRVLLEGPLEEPGWRPASRALGAAVGKPGKDTVAIAIDPDAPIDPGAGPTLAAALGVLAGRQLGRFGALVATGGETARLIRARGGAGRLLLWASAARSSRAWCCRRPGDCRW